ncbi:hypothetical protein [Antrihabitans cavernicola]|uniref:Uncharacterized protein n=1 Tax=Antrihabitans cavernicola TaxID=2495913 RepID=A0A5A7S871_9NOCA|nr:hypothetical protein [Spelaeibacter cavernicola]KAA0021674.1 hypothetical protein FOY51_17445 [Spelaeibacter cavernicola]
MAAATAMTTVAVLFPPASASADSIWPYTPGPYSSGARATLSTLPGGFINAVVTGATHGNDGCVLSAGLYNGYAQDGSVFTQEFDFPTVFGAGTGVVGPLAPGEYVVDVSCDGEGTMVWGVDGPGQDNSQTTMVTIGGDGGPVQPAPPPNQGKILPGQLGCPAPDPNAGLSPELTSLLPGLGTQLDLAHSLIKNDPVRAIEGLNAYFGVVVTKYGLKLLPVVGQLANIYEVIDRLFIDVPNAC